MVNCGLLHRYRDTVGSASEGAVLYSKTLESDSVSSSSSNIIKSPNSAPPPQPTKRFFILQDEELPQNQQELIDKHFDVLYLDELELLSDPKNDKPLNKAIEGVFWCGHDRVPIELLPELKVISNEGAGYEFFEIEKCLERNIWIL